MRIGWLIGLVVAMAPASAPAQPAATQAGTGKFDVTFTERSPESAVESILKRIGWTPPADAPEREYELGKESFVAYVPENYAATKKFGLLVFISPGGSGDPPQRFVELLDKYRLIWIGPNKVGNQRAVWVRMGLALDAVHNMKSRYAIDERRIYVSGTSGGGRVSSFLGVCYADVFSGGLYIIGTDYYRALPTGRNPNEFWPKGFSAPSLKLLTTARKHSRHVMLNGDGDMNRFQSSAIAQEMKRDGFLYVTYLEAPGVGHALPRSEWIEKAIVKLDEPLDELAEKEKQKAAAASRPAATKPALAAATEPVVVEDEPARELKVAKMYLTNHMTEKAKEKLKGIVEKYPGTPAQQEASTLLVQMGK